MTENKEEVDEITISEILNDEAKADILFRFTYTLGKIACPFVVLVILFKVFTFSINVAGSMEPTIYEGDVSILLNNPSKIERGDIIEFISPINHTDIFSKRVIGIPGDDIVFEDGNISINSKSYDEEYIKGRTFVVHEEEDKMDFTVSEDCYFLLGDNRESSLDSRNFGEIEKDKIIGKTVLRIPIGRIKKRLR